MAAEGNKCVKAVGKSADRGERGVGENKKNRKEAITEEVPAPPRTRARAGWRVDSERRARSGGKGIGI